MKKLVWIFSLLFIGLTCSNVKADVKKGLEIDVYSHIPDASGTAVNLPNPFVDQVVQLTANLIKSGDITTYKLIQSMERQDDRREKDKNSGRAFCVEPTVPFLKLPQLLQQYNDLTSSKTDDVTYNLRLVDSCE